MMAKISSASVTLILSFSVIFTFMAIRSYPVLYAARVLTLRYLYDKSTAGVAGCDGTRMGWGRTAAQADVSTQLGPARILGARVCL